MLFVYVSDHANELIIFLRMVQALLTFVSALSHHLLLLVLTASSVGFCFSYISSRWLLSITLINWK